MLAEHDHREVAVLRGYSVQGRGDRHMEVFRIAKGHVQHQPLSIELVVQTRQHVRGHELLTPNDVVRCKVLQGETAGIGRVVSLQPSTDFPFAGRFAQEVEQADSAGGPSRGHILLYLPWLLRLFWPGHDEVPLATALGGHEPLPEAGSEHLQSHLRLQRLVPAQNRGSDAVAFGRIVEPLVLVRIAELAHVLCDVSPQSPIVVGELEVLMAAKSFHESHEVWSKPHALVLRHVAQLQAACSWVPTAGARVFWPTTAARTV